MDVNAIINRLVRWVWFTPMTFFSLSRHKKCQFPPLYGAQLYGGGGGGSAAIQRKRERRERERERERRPVGEQIINDAYGNARISR